MGQKDMELLKLKARMFDIQVEQEQLQLKSNALEQEKKMLIIKISECRV